LYFRGFFKGEWGYILLRVLCILQIQLCGKDPSHDRTITEYEGGSKSTQMSFALSGQGLIDQGINCIIRGTPSNNQRQNASEIYLVTRN
jgi:hypothetical protein